jgi:hypothetical protein
MPVRPLYNNIDALPVETPEDVARLVDMLVPAADDDRLAAVLGDHFSLLSATHPEWFTPYRELVLTERLDPFQANFGAMCMLFGGASEDCVEHLLGRLRDGWSTSPAWALASIGTEASMTALADWVRAGGSRSDIEELGVWVPLTGPAQYRFPLERKAAFIRRFDDPAELSTVDNPVGLPLSEVLRDPEKSPVTWHYVSLRVDQLPGMAKWPAPRVHLVAPRADWEWHLTAAFDEQGRYHDETAQIDGPPDAEGEEYLRHSEEYGGNYGAVDLRPYDGNLVYCNGHVELTPDVVGTVGGPPIGIYANPHCPTCDRLMFHVASIKHDVREYGDGGWRSLFVCEDCQLVTCNATGWN